MYVSDIWTCRILFLVVTKFLSKSIFTPPVVTPFQARQPHQNETVQRLHSKGFQNLRKMRLPTELTPVVKNRPVVDRRPFSSLRGHVGTYCFIVRMIFLIAVLKKPAIIKSRELCSGGLRLEDIQINLSVYKPRRYSLTCPEFLPRSLMRILLCPFKIVFNNKFYGLKISLSFKSAISTSEGYDRQFQFLNKKGGADGGRY